MAAAAAGSSIYADDCACVLCNAAVTHCQECRVGGGGITSILTVKTYGCTVFMFQEKYVDAKGVTTVKIEIMYRFIEVNLHGRYTGGQL
ncbi:hypothetical protein F2P81_020693 [Scophthalmus maximus]|uniref:Uncharacterized protein n=1 Tax=Scophthalmus maximus TaxID=52904 RepID=A0A6A4SB84_SCOMX|nr:hypothetical protein F2P81_020693 [Scophthalmus maximus]